MRCFKFLLIASLTAGLGACAAKPKGPLKAGFQSNGSYLTSKQERKMSCKNLTNLSVVGAAQVGGLQSQANVSTGVGIAMAVATLAISGGTYMAYTDLGASDRAERDKQTNRLDEYNKILVKKGCKPVNIDAEIAKASAKAAAKKKS